MLWESKYWKASLGRDASALLRLSKSGDEISVFKMERIVFLSAYSMRKFIESRKITNLLQDLRVNVLSYKRNTNNRMRPWNLHDIDKHYQIDIGDKKNFDVSFFLNQIIHSKIFLFSSTMEGVIVGFFVSSDKMSSMELYYVEICDYISIMRLFSKNFPTGMHWSVRDNKEKIEIV